MQTLKVSVHKRPLRAACIIGETVDLSRTGIGFVVPSIRAKEKYLVGQERHVNVEIDLPTGKVNEGASGNDTKRLVTPLHGGIPGGSRHQQLNRDRKANFEAFLKEGGRAGAKGTAEDWNLESIKSSSRSEAMRGPDVLRFFVLSACRIFGTIATRSGSA